MESYRSPCVSRGPNAGWRFTCRLFGRTIQFWWHLISTFKSGISEKSVLGVRQDGRAFDTFTFLKFHDTGKRQWILKSWRAHVEIQDIQPLFWYVISSRNLDIEKWTSELHRVGNKRTSPIMSGLFVLSWQLGKISVHWRLPVNQLFSFLQSKPLILSLPFMIPNWYFHRSISCNDNEIKSLQKTLTSFRLGSKAESRNSVIMGLLLSSP